MKTIWIVLSIFVLLAAIFVGSTLFVLMHFKDLHEAADFGASFGFVSAIVSSLAVLAVVITLQQQNRLIKQGQQQLKVQQEELRESQTEFAKQSFDTSFFQLLQLLQNIVEENGAANFEKLYNSFGKIFQNRPYPPDIPAKDMTVEERRQDITKVYERFYKSHSNEVGHYFRTLYHIYRFINESKLSKNQKQFYARIVRAQLSQYQLLMLFYNCQTQDYGYPKFFDLIEKYDVLDNMGLGDLLVEQDVRLYPSLND